MHFVYTLFGYRFTDDSEIAEVAKSPDCFRSIFQVF